MADGESSSASSTPPVGFKGRDSLQSNGVHGPNRNASDHSLKRKANDLDSDIHDHGSPSADSYMNGSDRDIFRPPKRSRADELTPPPSDSPSPPSSGQLKAKTLKMIESFKQHEYPEYERLYRQAQRDGDLDQIKKVQKMHHRLVRVKEKISQEVRQHWL